MRSVSAAEPVRLRRWAAAAGVDLPLAALGDPSPPACPVHELAQAGVLWLTGPAGGPPAIVEAPVIPALRAAARALQVLCPAPPLRPDEVGGLLVERAIHRRMSRNGTVSANGSCRLLRCTDGWLAVNLPRQADLELLPAWLGDPAATGWDAVRAAVAGHAAADCVAAAGPLGLAVAALPGPDADPSAGPGADGSAGPGADGSAGPGADASAGPVTLRRLGAPGRLPEHPVILDFTSLWAGPLCAHLLGRAGGRIRKAEDPRRPDGARRGDPALFARLHAGHDLVPVDFATGRAELARLAAVADIVLESSRPRALEHLGLSPSSFLAARAGRIWVSITGYGRTGAAAQRIAFGDDAAVAGGLVARSGATPQFVGDAIADPLAGVYAALGAAVARAAGGGIHVDVALRDIAAYVGAGAPCPGPHTVERDGADWHVRHGGVRRRVRPPC